jgi:hypothetical protein
MVIGLVTAQLLDEIDHALVGHPRSAWTPVLEDLYQKALEHMGIIDEINACGETCSKDECVYEAALNYVREGLCST